jgi:DNA-binding MarR family transcriptional regulator
LTRQVFFYYNTKSDMALQNTQKSALDEIPYLLHHLSFLLDKEVDSVLTEELDLGLSQLKVLYVLDKWPYSQQRSIARILGQDDSGVSRIINQLAERGLVARKDNPKDRRQHIIAMTSAGTKLMEQARTITQRCHETALTGLAPDQRQQLRTILEQLHRRSCTPESGCERYIR